MILHRFALASFVLATAAVGARAADFYHGFESANSAGSPWTLGYYDASFTTFTTFGAYEAVNPTDGLEHWYDPSNQVLLVPAAFKNVTGNTVHGFAPGEAGLHGGQNGEIAVARFTAVAAGMYNVSALFGAGDTNAAPTYGRTDDYVRVNGTTVSSLLNTAGGLSYGGSVYLAAGGTVEFAVGIGGDTFYNDSTPLVANVTAVPAPGALVVFGLGMIGRARRRK